MSEDVKTYDVACPACGSVNLMVAHQKIDVTANPDLKKKLFEGQINITKCKNCSNSMIYDEYFLYVDREKKLLINVFPESKKEEKDSIYLAMIKDLIKLHVDDNMPSFIVFGYRQLAQIIGSMENPEIEKKLASNLDRKDSNYYVKLFPYCEEMVKYVNSPDWKTKSDKCIEKFQEAISNHSNKDYEKADKLYDEALEIFPIHYPSLFNSALLSSNVFNNFDKAKDLFERCREIKANDNELLFALAQVYLKLGFSKQSLNTFLNCAIIAPDNYLVWFNLGLAFVNDDQLEDGLSLLIRSKKLAENKDDKNLIENTINQVKQRMQG